MGHELLSQEEVDSLLRGVTGEFHSVRFSERELEYIMAILKTMPYDQVHSVMHKLESSYREVL